MTLTWLHPTMALSQRIAAVATHLANNPSEEASEAQRDAMIQAVSSGHHTPSQLVHAAGAIAGINWHSTSHRDAVMTALSGASTIRTSGTPWQPQSYHNFAAMLTAVVWAAICDPALDVNQKGSVLFRFLRALGLRQPSEPTYARITGLMAVACSGAQQARDQGPDEMSNLFQHIKALWKGSASGQPPPQEYIAELPENAFALEAMHPLTYQAVFPHGSPPVGPQLSMVDVCMCSSRVPMRRRAGGGGAYGGVGGVGGGTMRRSNSAAGDGMQQVMGAFTGMMQQMFQMAQGGGNGGMRLDNGANLTFGGSPGPGGSPAPGGSPGPQPGNWAAPGTQRCALRAAAETVGAPPWGGAGAAAPPAFGNGDASSADRKHDVLGGEVADRVKPKGGADSDSEENEETDEAPAEKGNKCALVFPKVANKSPDEAAALLAKAIAAKGALADEAKKAKHASKKGIEKDTPAKGAHKKNEGRANKAEGRTGTRCQTPSQETSEGSWFQGRPEVLERRAGTFPYLRSRRHGAGEHEELQLW